MTTPLRILVVEDSADDAELTILALSRSMEAPDWERVESAEEMRAALAEAPWDVVLSDFSLPGFGAAEALTICREADPDLPFIVISGTIGEQRAVEMMREGAGDYLLKGSLSRLAAAVEREVREAEGRRAHKRAELAMVASESRYRRLFEAAQDGILIVDAVSRQILDANPFLAELLGYRLEELLGKELWEIGLYRDIEANKAGFRALQEQGYIRYEDLPLVTKDGRQIQVEFISNTYDAGDARVIQCNIRDVTERKRAEERLAWAAVVLANIRDAVVMTDTGGIVTYWNDGATNLFGWTGAEMLERPSTDRVPEAYRDRMAQSTQAILAGEEFAGEWEDWHKNGSPVWIDARVRRITDADGQVVGVLGISHDITARKEAEEVVRASELRFRTLIAATAAMVWDSPASGRFDTDQPAWTEFTGQTVEEHRGWGWLDAVHPDDQEKSGRAWAAAVAGKSDYQIEHRVLRADGVYRHMTARAVPILGPDGTIHEWVGVHTDIDDLKMAEEKVRQRERHLAAIIENSPDCVKVVAPDGTVLEMNAAGLAMVEAVSPDQVIGKSVFDLLAADSVERFRDFLEGTCQGRRMTLTYDAIGLAGGHRTIQSVSVPLALEDGTLAHLGVARDITEARILEQQLRQAQKMEAFGQLAGGVAHDFNNLLTIINGYSELLLDSLPRCDTSWEMIAEIHQAGERSAGLTRQLLAFSRQQILAPRILNVNEVVADTDKMLRRLIGEDIRLTTTLGTGLWAVLADPGQVEQMLLNLAVNARDAMPQGGRLTIETTNVVLDAAYVRTCKDAIAGPNVVLSVSDTGVGIPPEVMAKIFEPFFTTKEAGKGTGLGLATVYGIVKQSGGHVAVHSEVGIGTTFKLYLPQVEQPTESSQTRSPIPAPPRGTETILLAEDEAAVRGLTRTILTACGYQVLEAADGDEAVRVAVEHEGPIHLLLTDVVMPGVGGRAVAERLTEQYPGIRVIYVSGYTDDAVIRHGVLRDVVNFIQKPFTPAALARRVRDVLDGKKS